MFQAEDGIRDYKVTGVQTCALPISVLLSLSGTAVGILAGVFLGWVGTHAISGELNFQTVTFAMSAPQTLIVAAVAIVAGKIGRASCREGEDIKNERGCINKHKIECR